MVLTLNCEFLFYPNESCLIFQNMDINGIEHQLNKKISNICDWFVDNKLGIHLGEDKTKSILFFPVNNARNFTN